MPTTIAATGTRTFPPGEGSIDCRQVLRQLEDYGFRGALILELSGKHGTGYGATVEEARQARQCLQGITRGFVKS